jgi:predicted enzyme related to lactoylglutathione lyase
MERVSGIGGFFFASSDPSGLGQWYEEHLGVTPPPQSYDTPPWWQEQGPTVFAGMDHDSPALAPGRVWAVNFRVRNLDAMVAQLEAAGIHVERDPEEYPNGTFAGLHDPEGNPIQLWQPAGADLGSREAAEE